MKRMIKAAKKEVDASEGYKEYKVTIDFDTYIGSENEYEVFSSSPEAAKQDGIDYATDDLEPIDTTEIDKGEYEVEIQFAGMVGVSEIYTVYADNEEEAEETAIEEARYDLRVVSVEEI